MAATLRPCLRQPLLRRASRTATAQGDDSDSQASPAFRALSDWMAQYYKQPDFHACRQQLARALELPDAMVGEQGGCTLYFFATACRSQRQEDVLALYQAGLEATGGRPEATDFLLRLLHVTHMRASDSVLDMLHTSLASMGDFHAVLRKLRTVRRAPLLEWPVPALQPEVLPREWDNEACPYLLFPHAQSTRAALGQLPGSSPQEVTVDYVQRTWGALVTGCIVEAYWGAFFASGNAEYLRRVHRVAMLYEPFVGVQAMEHFQGDAHVPESVHGDPKELLPYISARVAISTLVTRAPQHPAVQEVCLEHQAEEATASAAGEELLGMVGRERLRMEGRWSPNNDKDQPLSMASIIDKYGNSAPRSAE